MVFFFLSFHFEKVVAISYAACGTTQLFIPHVVRLTFFIRFGAGGEKKLAIVKKKKKELKLNLTFQKFWNNWIYIHWFRHFCYGEGLLPCVLKLFRWKKKNAKKHCFFCVRLYFQAVRNVDFLWSFTVWCNRTQLKILRNSSLIIFCLTFYVSLHYGTSIHASWFSTCTH